MNFPFLFCVTCLFMGLSPAQADLVELNVPLLSLEVGGHCAGAPKGTVVAPDTRDGQVIKSLHPYDFVVQGGTLPGAVDMGIGLVLRFKEYVPGETMILQAQLLGVDPKADTWTHKLSQNGTLWFGFLPTPGKAIDLGHYRFWVKRGTATLLVYDIVVNPANKTQRETLCHPDVS